MITEVTARQRKKSHTRAVVALLMVVLAVIAAKASPKAHGDPGDYSPQTYVSAAK